MSEYDIFISYRRKGGYETAKHLYDLLTRDGYSVSFDIDTLGPGDFKKELKSRVKACTDFILIVDSHTFDRSVSPKAKADDDYLRLELACALKFNKNVIPIMLHGVQGFPEKLPEDIAAVKFMNGPEYTMHYFDSFYRKLCQDFLKTSRLNISDGMEDVPTPDEWGMPKSTNGFITFIRKFFKDKY